LAQWAGQYSGRTHDSRVEEAERALSHAMEALRAASANDYPKALKSAMGLADRVLSARFRRLKALLSAADIPTEEARLDASKRVASLTFQLTQLQSLGVSGILAEFGLRGAYTSKSAST
jgi:hypothetical protein